MNIVFFFILTVSIYLITKNNPDSVMSTMLTGVNNSVSLALMLLGVYAIWLSVLKIFEKADLDKIIANKLRKPIRFLFKNESEEAEKYLSLNLSANLLGMGGASTPIGIKAIECMKHHKNKVMLVVVNASSIQLIPATIVAMRASFGSASDIILPSIIATFISTAVAVLLVKVFVK